MITTRTATLGGSDVGGDGGGLEGGLDTEDGGGLGGGLGGGGWPEGEADHRDDGCQRGPARLRPAPGRHPVLPSNVRS